MPGVETGVVQCASTILAMPSEPRPPASPETGRQSIRSKRKRNYLVEGEGVIGEKSGYVDPGYIAGSDSGLEKMRGWAPKLEGVA